MRTLLFRRGGDGYKFVFVARKHDRFCDFRFIRGERSRFIQKHGVYRREFLKRFAAFYEYAVFGGFPGTDHKRYGSGKPQRARTRHDEYRNADIDGKTHSVARNKPRRKGNQRNTHYHGDEKSRDGIRDFRDRHFCGIRVFDEFYDFINRAIFADVFCDEFTIPAAESRSADDFFARFFIHGYALARYRGFVGVTVTPYNHAVARGVRAVFKYNDIAPFEFLRRNLFFFSVYFYYRRIGSEFEKFPDSGHRLVFGLFFEIFAQSYKGDYHRRAFEVKVIHILHHKFMVGDDVSFDNHRNRERAVDKRNGRTERDETVHIRF